MSTPATDFLIQTMDKALQQAFDWRPPGEYNGFSPEFCPALEEVRILLENGVCLDADTPYDDDGRSFLQTIHWNLYCFANDENVDDLDAEQYGQMAKSLVEALVEHGFDAKSFLTTEEGEDLFRYVDGLKQAVARQRENDLNTKLPASPAKGKNRVRM